MNVLANVLRKPMPQIFKEFQVMQLSVGCRSFAADANADAGADAGVGDDGGKRWFHAGVTLEHDPCISDYGILWNTVRCGYDWARDAVTLWLRTIPEG